MVGRTPLKSKQIFGSTPSVASKRVSPRHNLRRLSVHSSIFRLIFHLINERLQPRLDAQEFLSYLLAKRLCITRR